jgi:hypothetical protein
MFCLRMPLDFGLSDQSRSEVEPRVGGSDSWVVAIEPMDLPGDRRLVIRRGASVGNQAELPVNPTPHELVLVGRHGHPYAALVDSTNAAWRGDTVDDSPDFTLAALTEVVVSGAALVAGDSEDPPSMQWVVWR